MELDLVKLVGLVFIDLKHAFDAVDQEVLRQKLVHQGIQQWEFAWFESCMLNRNNSVG